LFTTENPLGEAGDFKDTINPDSLQIISNAVVEPSLKEAGSESRYQFIRKGYFCLDKDSAKDKLVFNRTVTLKDAWAKEVKKN
jgi:glutaminyl-tRNA synthetase